MCLIVFDWRPDSPRPLVLASNRDEFYARPSKQADFWDEHPEIYAGQDLEQGGTWLGVSKTHRLAAVTNYRAPDNNEYPKSRGLITKDFLLSRLSARDYAEKLSQNGTEYAGYNALLFDGDELIYLSNRSTDSSWKMVTPGLYGLSNHLLDTPWPKVIKAKQRMSEHIHEQHEGLTSKFFATFEDQDLAEDADLPVTGVAHAIEKMLSAIFITSPSYGTRTSTLITVEQDGVIHVTEKNHATPTQEEKIRYQEIDTSTPLA